MEKIIENFVLTPVLSVIRAIQQAAGLSFPEAVELFIGLAVAGMIVGVVVMIHDKRKSGFCAYKGWF